MDDVLDWIGQQLLRAEKQAPISHAATTPSRSRVRLLARRHTRLSVAVAIVTLIVAFAAIADAAGVLTLPAFWQHEPDAPSPEGIASSIPTDLASSYAILRHARDPSIDALPEPTGLDVPGSIGSHYGVNVNLSRYAGAIDGTSFWLVPGNLGSCMHASNEGSTCTSNENMEASGTQLLVIPATGGPASPVTFLGIAPDNATITATNTDGSIAPMLRSGNAYTVTGDTNLHSVTVHEANGHDYTNYVPAFRPGGGPAARSIGPTQAG
jgi:hypothetical protein